MQQHTLRLKIITMCYIHMTNGSVNLNLNYPTFKLQGLQTTGPRRINCYALQNNIIIKNTKLYYLFTLAVVTVVKSGFSLCSPTTIESAGQNILSRNSTNV
jgi:hypothetical protein